MSSEERDRLDGYEPEPEPVTQGELLRAAPSLARLAVGAWLRTAQWTVDSSVRAGRQIVHAALSGESAAELLEDAVVGVREQARRVLGVTEIEEQVENATGAINGTGSLRERGSELLERSADVEADDHTHPAYDRILTQLAPDEARILRLMAADGPQAAVDVRTWRPLDVGSQLVAPGLSMISAHAGCRHPDKLPAYLNNLFRLGLIWFSREPLEDPAAYQVLEAQPDVLEALGRAGRARTVRRSIRLTPFGQDFCVTCLPVDGPAEDGPAEDSVVARRDRDPHAV